ncbi:DinB family protein [Micromonospora phytophila]|uniref:DinB family protein n=1 Tax=Micromonospora phytophila TaxID=709888 RepID=UPI00202EA786|nr:DinB family protein [Micromonospora phytophila]MCM0673318.1 DinB family protein [Micromonospora phytophila]
MLTLDETMRRLAADRDVLMDRIADRTEEELSAGYRVRGGPLGDFCESLRDLVAHVLMWDEINLAVLAEARQGRAHWSLDARWEEPQVGTRLNRSGVMAGRELPVELVVHRFQVVRGALIDDLSRYDEERWSAPVDLPGGRSRSMSELAQYVMTVPGHEPYWHAAIHLGELAAAA